MNFDALFQQQHALPSIPKVVQEVIDSFNNDSVSVEEIASKLAADQVLSAKLLRLANSSYYHVPRTVGTVDDAVLMLGFMTVRTLVISSGLAGNFKQAPGLDLKQFWRYGLHTAVAAKWLAKPARQNGELAFTAGLMHAIGQLLMRAAMQEKVMQVDKVAPALDARRADAERTSFGFNFYDVGAELVKRWRFPEAFFAAIKYCENPLAAEKFDALAAVVHVAAWLARAEENGYSDAEREASCPVEVLNKLGLSLDTLEEMPPLAELSAGLEDLIG